MRGGWQGRRRGRVLASLLLVTGLVAVGQVPAGAGPSSPADDVPQPRREVVPFVPELIDFGLLRDALLERYGDTFAGLVNNGDDSITIYETRPTRALHAWVGERFATAAEEKGIDARLVPKVTYRTAARPLETLFALKDRIMAARGTLNARGVAVESVGIQDSTNRVIVGVGTQTAKAQSVLETTFGPDRMQTIPWQMTEEADRNNDSAPWNGGDQIVSEGANFAACTTGFGVHDAGSHYVTTAGHCGTHFWWNTWAGFPIRNGSTFLGTTTGTVWNGVYSGFRIDTQKVLTTGSSNIIWTGTATRRFMSAPLDVAQGDPTCIEGSFSLTRCGTIHATDFGEGGTQYLVSLSSGGTVFGDSGAPSWRDSPFGPLAQGTHVGSLTTGLRVELNIFAMLFFNKVRLNTFWDP